MNSESIVVSGLPRSGTSLMMQMLDRGGIEVITDVIREADVDNPRGYYEFEQVKKTKEDATWIPEARGKAVKMVSRLLYYLPSCEKYFIIFMERELDEVLLSQEKMLVRLNQPIAPREQIRQAFNQHLNRLRAWLTMQRHMNVLYVGYNDLVLNPGEESARVGSFLAGRADPKAMASSVDPSLYRNQKIRENSRGR